MKVKFQFWAEVPTEIIEIPDEELNGLSEKEREKIMLKHHMRWVDRRLHGDWIPLPKAIDPTESPSEAAAEGEYS
jgi:hypothetical protein